MVSPSTQRTALQPNSVITRWSMSHASKSTAHHTPRCSFHKDLTRSNISRRAFRFESVPLSLRLFLSINYLTCQSLIIRPGKPLSNLQCVAQFDTRLVDHGRVVL